MGRDIRKKGKMEKITEFVERMKKVQEEVRTALKKTQKEMKRYTDRNRKETDKWRKENRVMLSNKDLVFKERPVHKLVERYVVSRRLTVDFIYFYFPSFVLFFLFFSFLFSIFRTTQVRGYQSRCHISHQLMA